MDYSLPGSSVHGILQARVRNGLPFPSPWDLPDPGVEPGFLASSQIWKANGEDWVEQNIKD